MSEAAIFEAANSAGGEGNAGDVGECEMGMVMLSVFVLMMEWVNVIVNEMGVLVDVLDV